MNSKLKLVIGGAATFLVVGGVTAGALAYANPTPTPGSPTTAPSASASQQAEPQQGKKNKQGKHGDKLLGRALHGEATVKGGKKAGGQTMVVVFQRGSVTAVSSTSITVKSEDGYAATYAIDGALRVRLGGADPSTPNKTGEGSLSDVKTGVQVRIAGVKDGSTSTAKRIIVVR